MIWGQAWASNPGSLLAGVGILFLLVSSQGCSSVPYKKSMLYGRIHTLLNVTAFQTSEDNLTSPVSLLFFLLLSPELSPMLISSDSQSLQLSLIALRRSVHKLSTFPSHHAHSTLVHVTASHDFSFILSFDWDGSFHSPGILIFHSNPLRNDCRI